MQWKSFVLMLHLVERGAMKKRQEQKRGSFRIEMNLVSGTRRTRGLNSGTYLTEGSIMESTSAFSLSATGRRWMCGNTSYMKISRFRRFIFRMREFALRGKASFMRIQTSCR